MKTKFISKILLSLGFVLVLGSAIMQVHGSSSAGPQDQQLPVVTIYSTGDVSRENTGSFVLSMNHQLLLGGTYINFSVSGTAIPGVDYRALVSPAHIGQSGYGTILVKTLPDLRGPADRQSYSVVVKLEPGSGYAIGEPSSATMWIKPQTTTSGFLDGMP
jgi:hypothetical protein